MDEKRIASLLLELPPVIARSEVGRLTGGVISPKTLANLDVLGEGPENRFRVGRKIAYARPDFIKWLEEKVVDV